MATHSSILAWRILCTEEPGGLQSMGSQTVRHDWSDLACTHIMFYHFILGWLITQPTKNVIIKVNEVGNNNLLFLFKKCFIGI